MLFVVQSQAPDCFYIFSCQGCEQQPYICDLVGDIVLAENVSFDHMCLSCLGDIEDTGWEDGITVLRLMSGSACLQWKCLRSSNEIDHSMAHHGLAGHPIDTSSEGSIV